jgi:hypothetical protein
MANLLRSAARSVLVLVFAMLFGCHPPDVSVELKATANDVFMRADATLTRDAQSDLNDFIAAGARRISRNSEELPRAKADIARFARQAVHDAERVEGRLTITRRVIRAVKRVFCPCYPFC